MIRKDRSGSATTQKFHVFFTSDLCYFQFFGRSIQNLEIKRDSPGKKLFSPNFSLGTPLLLYLFCPIFYDQLNN